jgi:hypothetical protein
MADFCKQCSEDLFGEDFGDLANLPEPDANGYSNVICEGCGMAKVDAKGVCWSKTCLKRHGMENNNA